MQVNADSFKQSFHQRGYAVVPGLMLDWLPRLQAAARAMHVQAAEPLEFEADLGYPGAPVSRGAEGGGTIRRVLDAFGRGEPWDQVATSANVRDHLSHLLAPPIYLSRAHHNCLMTKQAGFSSKTLWHQDIRYWSFSERNLVSVWIALGDETLENGALHVVPGSHRMQLPESGFDEKRFFSEQAMINTGLQDQVATVELTAGDVLFFHCRLLHAAGANRLQKTKYSLVFTYRGGTDMALPNTRSSAMPEVQLGENSPIA
ncbi:MAG: hypothetical protein DHS20C11_28890 [Lysobacteraceae bacterium]|nr:MAG: hypothetical protein DHS20C11_28890 [Xanthomonadaceae bacterium]